MFAILTIFNEISTVPCSLHQLLTPGDLVESLTWAILEATYQKRQVSIWFELFQLQNRENRRIIDQLKICFRVWEFHPCRVNSGITEQLFSHMGVQYNYIIISQPVYHSEVSNIFERTPTSPRPITDDFKNCKDHRS